MSNVVRIYPSPVTAGLHPVDLANCGSEAERVLRKRLHKARDVAGRLAWQEGGAGTAAIYRMAQEIADAWVFQPGSLEQLEDAIHLIAALFGAATIAERLEAPDA